jgi:hypothetical protein
MTGPSPELPLGFNPFQPTGQGFYPASNKTSICFQLRFPGPAQSYPAFLAFEVSPSPDQPGRKMPELGQLYLQLAFARGSTLCKNVEYQPGPVEHAAFDYSLKISFLDRADAVIENHQAGVVSVDKCCQLFRLALANIGCSNGFRTNSNQFIAYFGACGTCKL